MFRPDSRQKPQRDLLETYLEDIIDKRHELVVLGKRQSSTWKSVTQRASRIPLDNNPAENVIRPLVIGRKKWLFSDTPKGAQTRANLYSLIETAEANGVEPYSYLCKVFEELPKASNKEQIQAL